MNRADLIAAAERLEIPSYSRIDLVAARGEGAWIIDVDGTRYLDLYGGHAVALLGHSPARVTDAIANQARDLLFYSNAVHVPSRVHAAERLTRLAPWDDARVFFVNSGAEANETALKMARQATGRSNVVSFHGGFHGRTIGALAVCGMEKYRAPAAPIVDPSGAFAFAEFDGDLSAIDESCAAVIVEPIQSMGGMHVMRRGFAEALRARCDETGALLIFDEIQTAPARTGTWFGGDRWSLAPDLITTAKAVAAGFPAGVVLTHAAIATTVAPGDQGTTFGGGPLACAAIDATLAVLEEIDGPARARAIEAQVRDGLDGHEVLGRGALLGVRVPGPEIIARLRAEHRVLVGGCPGDATIIRLFPPLTIGRDELDAGVAHIREML
ncbi:MAG: aspartate aminotransferase family protein, partial [Planctomycetota bacterium]|nr:aspartate aminotransferase family protein [Planctomycetota bacterium]